MRDVEVHVVAPGDDPRRGRDPDAPDSAAPDAATLDAAAPEPAAHGRGAGGSGERLVVLRVEEGVTEVGRLDVAGALAAVQPPGDATAPAVSRDGAAPAPEVPAWLDLDDIEAAGGAVAVGTRLFRALFTPDMAAARREAATDDVVRLRLVVDDPQLARLPWELLHDPDDDTTLALSGPLVRDLAVDGSDGRVTATPPVRVLVAVAGPDGVDELDGDAEVTAIRGELQPLVDDGRLEVEALERATVPRLLDALRDERGVDVLHLVGHGRRTPEGLPTVVLEDDWGGPVDVTPGQLRDLVGGHGLSLVFLNVCGALSPGSDGTDDFARALVDGARVPALVGMQTAVADDLATQVARDFYGAIADLRPVDVALTDARRLIGGNEPGVAPETALPVCWLRSRDVALFPPVVAPRPPWWRWPLDHPIPFAGVAAAVVAALVLVVPLVVDAITPTPPMGELGFNVAVADFGGDAGLEGAAHELAVLVHDALVDDLGDTGLSVQFRGPADVGELAGSGEEDRATAAGRAAARWRADVVVDARLVGDTVGAEFVPTVWIADRRLLAASELTGLHALGAPERFRPGAVTDVTRIREVAVARTTALADLVAGLSLFSTGRPGQAGVRFDRAADAGVLGSDRGAAVLALFRGKAAAQTGDDGAARMHYEAALALDPDNGRAQYGLAEVDWEGARGSCTADSVDVEGLAAADQAFADVEVPDPDVADLAVKVDHARGRLGLCQLGAGVAVTTDPGRALGRVVAAHQDGNDRVRGLAGLASGLLAVQAWQFDGRLEDAVVEFERAVRLATTDRQEALHWRSLACLHLDRDDPTAADAAFARAIARAPDSDLDRLAEERATATCR